MMRRQHGGFSLFYTPIRSRGCYLGKYGQMLESLPGGRGYRCNRIYGPMPPLLSTLRNAKVPAESCTNVVLQRGAYILTENIDITGTQYVAV